METINDRINKVVISSKLTKTEFGKMINLSQSMVSKLCSGSASPSDRTISDICRVFHVSEIWLRTGEGGMIPEKMSFDTARTMILADSWESEFDVPRELMDKIAFGLSKLPLSEAMEKISLFKEELSQLAEDVSKMYEETKCKPPQDE